VKRLVRVEERVSITFSEPFTATVHDAAKRLRAEFDDCIDSAMKQELLFELGQSHRNLLERLRECTTPVAGCMSEVRVLFQKTEEGLLMMASDANAAVVRGLLTILERLISGHTITELAKFDFPHFFSELGIESFLSTQRRTGLEGVLQLLQQELQG
jgi:cysteine desulfuration protein SufE